MIPHPQSRAIRDFE